MATLLESPPSLRTDPGGVIRIGRSRVSLDLIVEQYENGMTPEELVRAYDTLKLADVYAAIGYYLDHRDEVKAYLEVRAAEAEAWKARMESVRSHTLMARRIHCGSTAHGVD